MRKKKLKEVLDAQASCVSALDQIQKLEDKRAIAEEWHACDERCDHERDEV